MTIYEILSLIGLPSIVAAMFIALYKVLQKNMKKSVNENIALRSGVQALLRAQMINDYNKWYDKGFAPIYAKENFENCWLQYEALGANGVMSGIHEEFMALPTTPKPTKRKKEQTL